MQTSGNLRPCLARLSSLLTVALMLAMAGCAQWSPAESDLDAPAFASLPRPKRSLDSVVVESVLVRVPKFEQQAYEKLWSSADESALHIELRTRLDQNGLRAGLIMGELPSMLLEQMKRISDKQNSDALEHAGLAADVDNKMRRLQCRAGRRKELIVRPQVSEPLTVLTTSNGNLRGNTLQQATILFDLRAEPHGDKRATLQLTPEIKHGDLKQTFISNEYGVRPQSSREAERWDDLSIEVTLNRGEVLMLTSTYPKKALGSAFFTTSTLEDSEEEVVLLLRLADTPLDELFAPEEVEQAQALMEQR